MKFVSIALLISTLNFSLIRANDFSSFLSANASLAVVVDHAYMQRRGENIMANFEKILSDIIRENLKNGGINVKYFSWNGIRLKKDFIAAMTVTDCENTWKFYEQTQINSVLLIAITDANCPRLPFSRALMIPIIGYGEEFPQIILDMKVQQILKWKSAITLLDETILHENPLVVESMMYESTRNHITPFAVYLYKIDDSVRSQRKRANIRQTLHTFTHQNYERHQFIVFSKFYEDIIEMAASLNMFNIYNQWLFFVFDESRLHFDFPTVTQSLGEGANIAFALNETKSDCQYSINCTIAEISMAFVTSISRIIVEEQSIYGEISDEEWESIRYTKQEKQDEILAYMKDYLSSNSKCSGCSKWRIETALTWGKNRIKKNYRLGNEVLTDLIDAPNKNYVYIDIGYWSPVLGFEIKDLIFPHIEHFFRNLTMDIITTHNPPWQILKKDSKGAIIEHSGITMEILKELSRLLNFTYQLYEIKMQEDEDQAGYVNDTSELVGSLTHLIPYQVVELIQTKQYFMAAIAATIDDADKKLFNYTIPISIQKYSFIARKPDEVSRIYLFTAPFTLETWGCLVGIILITAPVLYVINRLVPMQHLRIAGLCKIKNCFWYIYGSLLQQGGVYLPKADSGRLVIGVWWIVVIVLVTTYCGNLVAFLTFPQLQPGLDYLFQLFQQNQIHQFGLRNGTLFEKYASVSSREDIRKYMEYAIVYNNAQGEDISAVEKGIRVNIDWRINLQLIIQKHFERDKECKFSLSKENLLDEPIALIVPSKSPYLHLINEQIKLMFQMGFIERWHQTNLPSMDKCNGKGLLRQITNHKVNLNDMQGCFIVLLIGFIIALLIIVIEFWYYQWCVVGNKKNKNVFSK